MFGSDGRNDIAAVSGLLLADLPEKTTSLHFLTAEESRPSSRPIYGMIHSAGTPVLRVLPVVQIYKRSIDPLVLIELSSSIDLK
jgi:hypothetical protein